MDTRFEPRRGMPASYLLPLVFLAPLICPATAFSITAKDWTLKAQSWMNARDNGAYTATKTMYHVDESSHESEFATINIWFKDDPQNGWSSREDLTLESGCSEPLVFKKLSTPTVEEAFVGQVEVYPIETELVVSFATQSHSSMPNIFYAGDTSDTTLEALESLSTSAIASEEYVVNDLCFKLTITWDLTALNSLSNSDDYIAGTTLTSTYWVKQANGEPVMEDHTSTYDGNTTRIRVRWTSINTNPTLPNGIFDATAGSPSITTEDAMLDWAEENCD